MFMAAAARKFNYRAPIIAAAAGLALFVGGFMGHAEARMDQGDRMTAIAQECGFYQDMHDDAIDRYNRATTQEERDAASAQLMRAMNNWYAPVPGCDQYYGSISFIKSAPQMNPNLVHTPGFTSAKGTTSVAGATSGNLSR